MTIIRNLLPNPSFETGVTGWTAVAPGITAAGVQRTNRNDFPDKHGEWLGVIASDGTTHRINMTSPNFPAFPWQWIGARAWMSNDVSGTLRTMLEVTKTGGSTEYANGGILTSPAFGGRFHEVVTQADGDTSGFRITAALFGPASGANLSPVQSLWLDQVMVVVGTTEAEVRAALAAGYHDGDDPGWVWEGTPHASASRGPALPYTPDAQLIRVEDGARLDWLDLVTEYETTSQGQVIVTPTSSTSTPYIVRRGLQHRTGTMTVLFTRELATGTPGARSLALENWLRQGARLQVQFNGPAGAAINQLDVYATGRITRTLRPRTTNLGRNAVWMVEFEYTTALAVG